jgi:hypothetical protein
MKNNQNSEDALTGQDIMTYQFISNVALERYLPEEYLSLSKAEEHNVSCFQQLFTEYMMAQSQFFPEPISEPVAQLAKEIEKKELAGEQSDDSNKYDPCSQFAENLRMYRFIATSALAHYFHMVYSFGISKKSARKIIATHQTWTDCVVEQIETHHELFTKAFDQLAKEIKKKEKAAKVPQDQN